MFISKSRQLYIFLFDIMALNLLKRARYAKSDHIFKRGYLSTNFGLFEGLIFIISRKKLYRLFLLINTNLLSYISAFYRHFENFMF